MRSLKKLLPVFFITLIILMFIIPSCDEYQSKEFEIARLDQSACAMLADTLEDTVQTMNPSAYLDKFALSKFDTSFIDTMGFTNTQIDSMIDAWVDSVAMLTDSIFTNAVSDPLFGEFYAFLADTMNAKEMVVDDSMEKIRLQIPSIDTTYVILNTSKSSAIFFSNKNLNFQLLTSAGQVVSESDNTMPLETVAGCQEEVEKGTLTEYYPIIKTRLVFSVPQTSLFLRIMKHEQTNANVINMAIVENN